MISLNQEWINFSKYDFNRQKYESPRDEQGRMPPYLDLKPRTGMWFSLPTKDKCISEWGEYLSDIPEILHKYKDNGKNANIITVELNKNSCIVNLDDCKEYIINILKNKDKCLNAEEKRKILLENMKEKLKNDKLEHIILNLKKEDFEELKNIYGYEYNLDEKKLAKLQRKRLWKDISNDGLTLEGLKEYLNIKKNRFGIGRREAKDILNIISPDEDSIKSLYPETELIVDFFSGCINEERLPEYSVPSLVVFDTDCVDLISQRRENIFDNIKEYISEQEGEQKKSHDEKAKRLEQSIKQSQDLSKEISELQNEKMKNNDGR